MPDLNRQRLYSGLRFVDKLPNPPRRTWNWALTAQNLGDQSHPKYSGGSEIECSLYASVTWRD